MATQSVEKIVKLKSRKGQQREAPLTKEQVYALIRALQVAFPIKARPIFTRKATNRRPCYTRGQILLIKDQPTVDDILDEFAHALEAHRRNEGMKPHSPAFYRALDDVLKAHREGKS